MGQEVIIKYGKHLRYRPETISPISADLSSATHV